MFKVSHLFSRHCGRIASAAILSILPTSAALASTAFVDGLYMLNGVEQYHENDTDYTNGDPVHMVATSPSAGYGYVLEAAAAVNGGTADDGTPVAPMSLKAYTELGAIENTTDQVQLRNQAYFIAEFEILEAGTQSISLGWDGELYATGDAFSQYSLKVGFNRFTGTYQYNFFDNTVFAGTDQVFVDESHTLDFFIPESDIGRTYNLQIYLTTFAELEFGGGTTSGAYADFYDSVNVTNWSGGLSSLDGLTPASLVPVPPAVWLFSSGLLGLVGVARRKNNYQ